MTKEHIEKYCDIKGCADAVGRGYASHWIARDGGALPGTFYLCQDHKNLLQNDEEEYAYINDRNEIAILEIALYCCDEGNEEDPNCCETCND